MAYPERQLIITKDGSHTVSIPEMNVTYHSHHGAIQESLHVFINAGLKYVMEMEKLAVIDVFEMGFGTGLNALLTMIEAEKLQRPVQYTAIELYPLQEREIKSLNYCEQLNRPDLESVVQRLHSCEWEKEVIITPFVTFNKIKVSLFDFNTYHRFNVIYYDSFAPSAQPEHWTTEIFEKLHSILLPGGILVTYCSKSIVRKAMQAAGFVVTKIQGPWGKREMIRAIRIV
jgi:tRNA U34 5-methylaminomethyl-2-thiouridine-forming methyltransferase MnmC